MKSDAEVYFAGWQPPRDETSWMLLCDPPYHSSVAAGILQRLTHGDPAAGFAAGIIEHGAADAFDDTEDGPWKISTRRYGETCLTVVRCG